MPFAVKFTPEIQGGHLLQAGVLVVTMAGWALWGYGQLQSQIADDRQIMALMKQRQDQFSDELRQINVDQRASNADTRSQLKEISDAISNLRVLVAPKR